MTDPTELELLQAENETLRTELGRQWRVAHSERCDRWPCEGECCWPMPDVLRSDYCVTCGGPCRDESA